MRDTRHLKQPGGGRGRVNDLDGIDGHFTRALIELQTLPRVDRKSRERRHLRALLTCSREQRPAAWSEYLGARLARETRQGTLR